MKTPITLTIICLGTLSAHAIDLNSNGINDVFEAQFPVLTTDIPTADTDGDGFDNMAEARALTDPTDPTDCFKCHPLTETATSYTVSWPSNIGLSYQIQHSQDGQIWNNVGTVANGNGGNLSQTIAKAGLAGTSGNFFRVQVAGEIDSDNDGLADWAEALLQFGTTSASSVRSAANGGDQQQLTNLLTGANPSGGLAGTTAPGTPSAENASRFLAQTTFGPRLDDIADLQALGDNAYEKWIDLQQATPASHVLPYFDYIDDFRREADFRALAIGTITSDQVPYDTEGSEFGIEHQNFRTPWMRNALNAPDQLRQRTAWALSQVLVIGQNDLIEARIRSGFSYYDFLLDNAFGNFADLLTGVTRHPAMGMYLNHFGNREASADGSRQPDENYAREIMQLFSIGTDDLEVDGSVVTDSDGVVVESYDNEDIVEMARIFTGYKFFGRTFGNLASVRGDHLTVPMDWDLTQKDSGPKTILRVRDVAVTVGTDSYTLEWSNAGDFDYAIQILDLTTGTWSTFQVVEPEGEENVQMTIAASEAGAGLSEEQFRVKHYISGFFRNDNDFIPVDVTEQASRYVLNFAATPGAAAYVVYRLSDDRSPTGLRVIFESSGTSITETIPKGDITFGGQVINLGDGLTSEEIVVLPAGTPLVSGFDPETELEEVIRILTLHPNTAPFMANRLIKHFVSSSPSPDYIARVANVFRDNGSGVTGDLGAMVKAILLDPEARGVQHLFDERFGKLKEPMLRLTMAARALDAGRDDNYDPDPVDPDDHFKAIQWWERLPNSGQVPLESPSVFNYYSPDYRAPGLLREAGLDSPEFEILNDVTSIVFANAFHDTVISNQDYHYREAAGDIRFRNDYSKQELLANRTEELLDEVNLLFTHGNVTAESRQAIRDAVDFASPNSGNTNYRVRTAIYLTLISPNGAILK